MNQQTDSVPPGIDATVVKFLPGLMQRRPDALADSSICRALLKDYCEDHKREYRFLANAEAEQIPAKLLQGPGSVPIEIWLDHLQQCLVTNRAMSPDAAEWTVNVWAEALGKETRDEQQVPREPCISLSVSTDMINGPGHAAILSWVVQNATQLLFEPAIGDVLMSGSCRISPLATTTYKVTAIGPGGTAESTVTLRVAQPTPHRVWLVLGTLGVLAFVIGVATHGKPKVETFGFNPATIEKGKETTLSWSVKDAGVVTIDGETVGPIGSKKYSPDHTNDFTLAATPRIWGETVTTTASVEVINIVRFDVSSEELAYVVRWDVQGASEVSISPRIGKVAASGSQKLWLGDGIFTLTATGRNGTTVESVATAPVSVGGTEISGRGVDLEGQDAQKRTVTGSFYFPQKSLQYMNFTLNLKVPTLITDQTIDLLATWYLNGKEWWRHDGRYVLEKGGKFGGPILSGWHRTDQWPTGKYRLELSIKGNLVGSTEFKVCSSDVFVFDCINVQ